MRKSLQLACLAASALTSQVSGQNQQARLLPITSPVKDAGTYHLATGTWTRKSSGVALTGPSQLYDNTCTVGFYTGVSDGDSVVDSGRIPSTDDGGLADCYEINCFQIGYCSFEPLVTTIGLAYFTCYAACDDFTTVTPAAAFALVNVPAAGSTATQGCWLVTFDLTNTTFTFGLGGNSTGSFDNVPSLDHFGWLWTQLIPTTGSNAGPIIAGDPLGNFNPSCGIALSASGQGAGTDHPGWGGAMGPSTGIGSELDQFAVISGTTGCFWFGGYGQAGQNPLAAFYHKLWGGPGLNCVQSCGPICIGPCGGSSFCWSDTGNCPGGAVGDPGAGCPHGAGPNGAGGAVITPTGNAQISNDTFGISLTSGPSSLGILIQGAAPISYPNGNNGVPDSAGLFCVAPQLRGNVEVTNLGASSDEAFLDDFQGQPFGATAQPGGSTTYYQFWFRDVGNPNANSGAGAEFNFSNALEVNWF